jgi:hypothetical protein
MNICIGAKTNFNQFIAYHKTIPTFRHDHFQGLIIATLKVSVRESISSQLFLFIKPKPSQLTAKKRVVNKLYE